MNIYTISRKTESQKVLLNKHETVEFQKRLDCAMLSFSFADFFYAILDFKLHYNPNVQDFLKKANEIINITEISETIVKKVIPYDTKCILCSIGKTIKGYEVRSTRKDFQNIEFTTKTALYFDVIDDELYDFGFCNGFLSKKEIEELTRT